jgi:flavin-dependent dehydrogenase
MSNAGASSHAASPAAAFDCDVAVIGGGPAGSAAAAWLARAGRRVIVVERSQFPRFHIGESLLASVNDALSAIGAADIVRKAGFPQKWGATFLTADGSLERYADFSVASTVASPQTWQVQRSTFDHLLLQHAGSSGADVRQRTQALDVDFDPGGVSVSIRTDAGERSVLRAACVIDASGKDTLLSRKFDLRLTEPKLANVAVFSHYSGVPRAEGRRSGDIRIVARPDLGWFWLIPISAELMSVGVVLPQAAMKASSADFDPADFLEARIADTPAVCRLLAQAKREWPVRVERDFSFGSRAYAGDRWLLAGDAGSFLDPVFSTGVAIALESGVEAAQAVEAAIASGNLSRAQFSRYERRQQQRYRSFRRFVIGFYTPEFRDLFFAEEPPPRMFSALVTVFAGYWHPPLRVRLWVHAFFALLRLQKSVQFAPHIFAAPADGGQARAAAGGRMLRARNKTPICTRRKPSDY